jgi:PAS domain S-box-containing protein
VRDISEKKKVELALRQANEELEHRVAERTAELAASEARYQELYHHAPDMFASIDAEMGRIVQCNRTLAESTGYTIDQLVGRGFADLIHSDCASGARQVWQEFVSTGSVRDRELILLCRDGRKLDISVNMSAFRSGDGRILHSQATFRDITNFKRAEQQAERHRNELAHVTRLAATGEMAAGLAHELNQPLYALNNFARGAIRRLKSGSLDNETMHYLMDQIARESQRAGDIIRSLRRYVGKREQQRAAVDINESTRRVVRLLANEVSRRDATLELQLADDIPSANCDAIQIEQVLMNLILNALEAIAKIPRDRRNVLVQTELAEPRTIQIDVTDCGPGLPAGQEDKIFDAFYSTKESGFGLGLAISRTIVEAHGGRLVALPGAGAGATFRFTLPARPYSSPQGS